MSSAQELGARILSREECESIAQRVRAFVSGGGRVRIALNNYWTGELRWARNRVSLASDRRDVFMLIERTVDGLPGEVYVNQVDDVSLKAAVHAAERSAKLRGLRIRTDKITEAPDFTYLAPPIWSDATYNFATSARAAIAKTVIDPAEAQEQLSAGYIEVRGVVKAVATEAEDSLMYTTFTQAQCSMTVRDAGGTGSGWAGLSGYDWAAIDATGLAKRALEKAIASRNPVAIEPGRYTTILEPQAVHDLVEVMMPAFWREIAEDGRGPFTLAYDHSLNLWRTKLGLKVIDERITIDHDLMDPHSGILPYDSHLVPRRKVTWIERGVLKALATSRELYALPRLNDNFPDDDNSQAYRMSGGNTTMEEMIATTKRGLIVTRFSKIRELDFASLLTTGLTRDGLWLVENGKISKAVKNFRFTESPLFILNNVEQLGVPVPVFRPIQDPNGQGKNAHIRDLTAAIVPPLKVRDFSFTAMIDAV